MKKTILITGVTRGLGLALARYYMAEGHTVIGCGRSAEPILDLRFAHAAPNRFDIVDVADASRVAVWAETVLASNGAPDVIVNNAAVINPMKPLWEIESSDFSKLVDVNIKGVFNVIHAFLPAMIEKGTGTIVNLSSGWGRFVSPNAAPYCASKWAIEGLTKALAEELPEGLSAVPMSPGIVNTDMLQTCFGESAVEYPTPDEWVKEAGPFILSINRSQNGESVTVPGQRGD